MFCSNKCFHSIKHSKPLNQSRKSKHLISQNKSTTVKTSDPSTDPASQSKSIDTGLLRCTTRPWSSPASQRTRLRHSRRSAANASPQSAARTAAAGLSLCSHRDRTTGTRHRPPSLTTVRAACREMPGRPPPPMPAPRARAQDMSHRGACITPTYLDSLRNGPMALSFSSF